jgi:hypothetical protein
MLFAYFDTTGRVAAAHNDATVSTLPDGAVELTEEQWTNRFSLRLVGDVCIVDPPEVPLDDAQAEKRRQMEVACREAIQGGIVCNALGADHEYPTTLTDQQNLAATVLAAQVNGAAGEPYKFWCADSGGAWARRPHTAAQILAVGEAVRAHVVAQQEHYEQKLIEIDQATAETISTITW